MLFVLNLVGQLRNSNASMNELSGSQSYRRLNQNRAKVDLSNVDLTLLSEV
jgi:hypothetical protein